MADVCVCAWWHTKNSTVRLFSQESERRCWCCGCNDGDDMDEGLIGCGTRSVCVALLLLLASTVCAAVEMLIPKEDACSVCVTASFIVCSHHHSIAITPIS